MKLNFCVACGADDIGALELHHLVPRSHGGTDDETNLITLCSPCHGKVHGVRRDVRLSAITKQRMAIAKQRGVKFGRPDMNFGRYAHKASRLSVATRQRKAMEHYAAMAPILAEIQADGIASLRKIAEELNRRKIRTSRGNEWSALQVSRVLRAVT